MLTYGLTYGHTHHNPGYERWRRLYASPVRHRLWCHCCGGPIYASRAAPRYVVYAGEVPGRNYHTFCFTYGFTAHMELLPAYRRMRRRHHEQVERWARPH